MKGQREAGGGGGKGFKYAKTDSLHDKQQSTLKTQCSPPPPIWELRERERERERESERERERLEGGQLYLATLKRVLSLKTLAAGESVGSSLAVCSSSFQSLI